MIDTLIFDLGNVIVDFEPLSIYTKATGNPYDGKILYDLFIESGIWHELDRGLPLDDIIQSVNQQAPDYLHKPVEYVVYHWHEDLTINQEMEEYIYSLRPHFSLYLLSNVSKQFHEFKKNFKLLESFDGHYISADTQLLKPDATIYEDFLNTFNLQAEQCFFIDDKEENIIGARVLGIKGHIYDKDLNKLKNSIKKETGLSL